MISLSARGTRHMSDEEEYYVAAMPLNEAVNGTHVKYCSNCGKIVEKPVLSEGYVFCSEQCRKSFTTHR